MYLPAIRTLSFFFLAGSLFFCNSQCDVWELNMLIFPCSALFLVESRQLSGSSCVGVRISILLVSVFSHPITIPPETNSNDFGGVLQLISRFEFEFRRRRKFFRRIRIFGVLKVQSHTHHVALHVHACAVVNFAPTQFHFESCGVRDS